MRSEEVFQKTIQICMPCQAGSVFHVHVRSFKRLNKVGDVTVCTPSGFGQCGEVLNSARDSDKIVKILSCNKENHIKQQ